MEPTLIQKLENKSISKEQILKKVKQNDNLIPEIISGISSSKPAIRYGCAKILMDLSEEQPEKLYPHWNFFINLLDSKYRILTWNAIIIIANLTKVDTENKFDSIFKKYFSYLDNEYMVTVANIIGNSCKIALAKPHLVQKITDELLKVENISITPHLSEECKRVIAGHAIKFFDMFFDQIKQKDRIVLFIRKHLDSSRNSLQIDAQKFLKKWD